MSIHLPAPKNIPDPEEHLESGSSNSESSDNEDQTWDDWVSDSEAQRECPSLFEDKTLPSAEDALKYDSETHGFNIDSMCSKLALDFHGRVRVINYIRKNRLTPSEALAVQGSENWLKEDEYLVPTLENDPLLRRLPLQSSVIPSHHNYAEVSPNDWSDDEDENEPPTDPSKHIQWLEKKLVATQLQLKEYHQLLTKRLDAEDVKGGDAKPSARDDDTHYFQSYAENDIHAVMINDKVRTSTYANFILTSPNLFRDAIVLDVGCGTGILSLFAARAGAKRVIAVDASDVVEKAAQNVKVNGFDDIITVVRGKVETVVLPDDIQQVDIIISEWMGYALLYESMLDSVLHARDRFLRPGGVMAPSQCKMMLGLCDASEIYKERIGFWDDVYGFDMSVMASDLYDEAIIDVVGPETLLSTPVTVKDLHLGDITARQLDFSSPFTLVSDAPKRTKINSLILYFDTFFTTSGNPVPPETEVKVIKEGEAVLAELWPVGGKPAPQRRQSLSSKKEKITSFSTGPQSSPTHWKQALFMLKEPFWASEGSTVTGTFYCHKSENNSRELNVEIHYSVHGDNGPGPTIVQMYNVR
ncbi:arginine N-methyltransferase 3 [Coprinopsis sp. MPI-PUGE-AT-0042]|nr:arginine N-methyltransferase 3 [Coprinopsis sp. MPI-PUGE-AT-0042]